MPLLRTLLTNTESSDSKIKLKILNEISIHQNNASYTRSVGTLYVSQYCIFKKLSII